MSYVYYNSGDPDDLNNAFWDGIKMTYSMTNGINFGPLSLAADVVTHELTHDVTEYSSGLIYENESGKPVRNMNTQMLFLKTMTISRGGQSRMSTCSLLLFEGALNEAISDIFGALFDSFMGKGDTDTWLVGEDAFTPNVPGDALRLCCATQKKTRHLPVGISIVETTIQIVIKDRRIMEVFI